jgi:phthalate 4,5-cis-dihydrodiol dehydrogenase
MRALKMGMIGLGQGAAGTLPAMAAMPEIDLVAGADQNPAMRAGFSEHYPASRAYASVTELCRDPQIDAVWIATPNRFHTEHAIEAMRAGKHVVVEKPMAISLDDADRMVDVARENGVTLLAGHTRSLSIWNRAMRRLALSGDLGALRTIHVATYTDWMIRPRTPDELDPNQGGGIVYRQGPHQIDTVRLLGGGLLRSVRGMVGQWMDARPIPGYFTAYLEFEDGTPATIMHNGYGYYATSSRYPWVREKREYTDADRAALRRELVSGARDESKEKELYRVGGAHDPITAARKEPATPYPWKPFDLGPVEVACERGVMLPAQWGLMVYGDDGPRELDLRPLQRPEPDPSGGLSIAVLEELHGAVIDGKRAYHTGEWGRATLEAALAVMQSATERREIMLTRQVAMPVEYDADLRIQYASA